MARSPGALAALFSIALASGATRPARAEDTIPGYHVDRGTTGAVIGIAAGIGVGAMLIPARKTALWEGELLGDTDIGVHENFSPAAGYLSDALLAAELVAPAVYLMENPIDDAVGDRLLIYGESVAVNVALVQIVKHTVQRPRPYLYNKHGYATAYAKAAGDDGRLSLYSGHAALSFGAAVTGAYLLGTRTDNQTVKNLAWGLGMATAAATANLRVRAGKHFYSDVLLGSVVGIAVGYAVPALHSDGAIYKPSSTELGLAAGGILVGALASQLIPFEKMREIQMAPLPIANGMGVSFGGKL